MRKDFFSDPCLAVCVDAVTIELDLERNREKVVQERTLKSLSELRAIWTDVDSVAVAVSAELTFHQDDGQAAAIRLLGRILDDVRALRSETLSRFVAGLLVFYLVETGRADQATDVWREQALPVEVGELVDLDGQSWRTMESAACARVGLLVTQGDFAAEQVASRLYATSSEHGLTRTNLRALALSMVVAEQSRQPDRALARLVEFLKLAREAQYVRPLVRSRAVSRAVLQRLIGTKPDPDTRDAAEGALAELDSKPDPPAFSPRELQVLAEVGEGRGNDEIAARLGIS